MAVADDKKCASYIAAISRHIAVMRQEMLALQDTKAKFETDNPETNGTPLQGKVNGLNGAINSLQTSVDHPLFNDMITDDVPTHRGEAL